MTNGGIVLASSGGIDNSGTIQLKGAWTNNANGLVNASTGSVVLNGSSAQNIGGSSSTVFHNLTLNNTAGASLTATTATVNGTLNLQAGVLNAGASNTVVINTLGNVTRTSGWVAGNLQKPVAAGNPSVTFEVGLTSAYMPVTQLFSGVVTPGSYTARVNPGLHPNADETCFNLNKYVNAHIILTNSGVSPANYRGTFKYSVAQFVGSPTPASLAVAWYSGGSWSYPTLNSSPTWTTIVANGLSGNGEFTIAQGCIAPGNDLQVNASTLGVYTLGACLPQEAYITNATVSAESNSSATTGEDLWYRFVAPEPGIRVEVSAAGFDALIELQNSSGTTIATENAVSGTGTEILNYAGPLTTGQTYYVAVRNYDSSGGASGPFTVCLQRLADSGCNSGPGPFTSCSTFKVISTNAATYSISFTNTLTSGVTTLNTAGVTVVPLSGLSPGYSYNVGVSCTFNLSDGAGNPEVITIDNPSACTITMLPHADVDLRTIDRCPPTGSIRTKSSIIGADTWLCGASFYQWEFTPVSPSGLSFNSNGPPTNRFLALSVVPAIAAGTTYDVRIRPMYGGGAFPGDWGLDYQCLQIAGSGGLTEEGNADMQEAGLRNLAQAETQTAVALYPNPIRGDMVNLNITDVKDSSVMVRILDATGRVAYAKRFATEGSLSQVITFDQPLTSGLYMVEITHGEELINERLVVQR